MTLVGSIVALRVSRGVEAATNDMELNATATFNSTSTLLDEVEPAVAWLGTGYIFFFLAFLKLIKPEFLVTFFSTQTCCAWVQSKFEDRRDDERKAEVMEFNKRLWGGIREDVKEWCLQGWDHWEDEKPAWFNPNWKSAVEDDMIPTPWLFRMQDRGGGGAGAGARGRRRSSFVNIVLNTQMMTTGGRIGGREDSVMGGAGEARVTPVVCNADDQEEL